MKETAIGRERMKKREKFTRQRGSDQGRVWGVRHRTRETMAERDRKRRANKQTERDIHMNARQI